MNMNMTMHFYDDIWIQFAILALVSIGTFALIDMLIDPFKLGD